MSLVRVRIYHLFITGALDLHKQYILSLFFQNRKKNVVILIISRPSPISGASIKPLKRYLIKPTVLLNYLKGVKQLILSLITFESAQQLTFERNLAKSIGLEKKNRKTIRRLVSTFFD